MIFAKFSFPSKRTKRHKKSPTFGRIPSTLGVIILALVINTGGWGGQGWTGVDRGGQGWTGVDRVDGLGARKQDLVEMDSNKNKQRDADFTVEKESGILAETRISNV